MRIRILSDENSRFIREIELFQTHTLFDLHKAIQIACDYDQSQLASFYIVNEQWVKQQELTSIPLENCHGLYPTYWMNSVKLNQVFSKRNKHIIYMFDLFSERIFHVYLQSTVPAAQNDLAPRMLACKGTAPRQLITGEAYIDNLLDAFSYN